MPVPGARWIIWHANVPLLTLIQESTRRRECGGKLDSFSLACFAASWFLTHIVSTVVMAVSIVLAGDGNAQVVLVSFLVRKLNCSEAPKVDKRSKSNQGDMLLRCFGALY